MSPRRVLCCRVCAAVCGQKTAVYGEAEAVTTNQRTNEKPRHKKLEDKGKKKRDAGIIGRLLLDDAAWM